MDLTWSSFTLREGTFIADLPGLEVSSVGVTMCDFSTATATLPIPTAPDDWERALLPGGSVLVLSDPSGPVWGGVVTALTQPAGDTVQATLATFERYLDARFVPDLSFTQVSQTQIAAALASVAQDSTPLVIEADESATLRDRTYAASDDMTVLGALQNLAAVQGGPEWTIIWRADGSRMVPVLRIADRLGVTTSGVTLELPGELTAATMTVDFSAGHGATRTLATSTADDGTRTASAAHEVTDPERPVWEYRWSPSSGISRVDTLDDYAAARVAWMADGAQSLTLTTHVDGRLLDGWDVGDTLAYSITSPALTTSGSARVLGWTANLSEPVTVTPILAGEG